VLVALLGAGGAASQDQTPPAAEAQTPVFRAGVNFVRVDVIVTDRSGNPVSDLTREDFEVSEDGRAQVVETFKLLALDGGRTGTAGDPPRTIRNDADLEVEAARDDVRLFAFFLDDYHVRRETGLRAREDLARFVETELGPSDLVGIMYPLQVAASVEFTRDHARVTSALRQFTGRKYDYTPRNRFEENYARYPTETVERIRNEVSLSGLDALLIRMGGLKEGRKSVVLLSEGYAGVVPPQLRSRIAGMPDFANPATGDPLAGTGSLVEDRAATSAGLDVQMQLRRVFTTANRNNVAIYPIDPRGLGSSEFGIDQNVSGEVDRSYLDQTMDTLRVLAGETDGRAIVNRNDLATAMRQIVRDASAYYLLGYNSSIGAADGKFHEIRVRVRRPGVQVRARNGYWALAPEEAAKASAPPRSGPPPAVTAALSALSRPTRGRFVRTWVGAERGADGTTRMTFLWEPLGPPPGSAGGEADRPAAVSLLAAGADGTSYFRGRLPASAARAAFEARPGTMQVRVAVENSAGDVLDVETVPIDVADLHGPGLSMATPVFYRTRTVREFQALRTDPAAAPTAAREFVRTDRVLVRVHAYGPPGDRPVLTARLLNRAGDPMTDLAVGDPAPAGVAIEVPLVGLATGEYLLEITAALGTDTVRELTGFRVTG
jgi:VWFA-related protein